MNKVPFIFFLRGCFVNCAVCVAVVFFLSGTVYAKSVLSALDVKTYKTIFAEHKAGNYQKAKQLTQKLSNKSLMGYVLYDKYMSAKYKTGASEIEEWLKNYKSYPVAADIHALGKKKGMRLKALPSQSSLAGGRVKPCTYVRRDEPISLVQNKTFTYLSGDKKNAAQKTAATLLQYLQKGDTAAAEKLIESGAVQSVFNRLDIDKARTALAFSFFLEGKDSKALSQAEQAIKGSGNEIPLAYWTAGLASWREKDYDDAAEYFGYAALHDLNYPLLRGSAAFWAARSYMKLGKFQKVGDFLELAANQPRTFYGMMALRMLGDTLDHVWDEPAQASDDIVADFSHPGLTRFYALKQLDKDEWAVKELTKVYLEADRDGKILLYAISSKNGFQDELQGLSGALPNEQEKFPVPNWNPQDGWKVDKSLVYAFVRQESCFNQSARSSVGARGLMQIMPDTGKLIARRKGIMWSLAKMNDTAYNLSLGQNYLLHLMDDYEEVGRNLIFIATAYNAGPGNLIKWKKQMVYQNDPLLFIESIPSRETRGFVERIMVNYWVYRSLMGESLDSLDDVIAGAWAIYRRGG